MVEWLDPHVSPHRGELHARLLITVCHGRSAAAGNSKKEKLVVLALLYANGISWPCKDEGRTPHFTRTCIQEWICPVLNGHPCNVKL